MSLYVLDTSVAVKWAIPEPDSLKALAFQDDVRNKIHEIIAPDVFAEEVAHVLTKAERRKIIPIGDAAAHLFDILQNGPTLHLRPYNTLQLNLDVTTICRIVTDSEPAT